MNPLNPPEPPALLQDPYELEANEERWHALTMGQCSSEEVEALRLEDPQRFELYRPFTLEEQEDLYRKVCESLDAQRASSQPTWRTRARRWRAWAWRLYALFFGYGTT
jgi:hypothetical protein